MRDLNIAYGNSRMTRHWSNKLISFDALCERLKTTVRTTESVEEYAAMKRAERDNIKDKGGFVGGHLKGGIRRRDCVASRSMLTADLDHAKVDFVRGYEILTQYASVIYSTHSHTPEAPRLRLIVPFTRDVSSDEYQAIARFFAFAYGIDQFDECSYRPHQLMYWPTTPANGEYVYKRTDGEWLDPDKFLAGKDWKDCSLLPTSSRESTVKAREERKLADPLTKKGIIGAFCRTYGVCEAIEEFLSDVYEPAAVEGRYQYIPADSTAGVIIYDDKFAYSFHASDPACGRALNAFDLVRVHKFGDDDEKKSLKEMSDFASKDEKVKLQIARDRAERAGEDFTEDTEDWQKKLSYQPRSGLLEGTPENLLLILRNDPAFANIAYNEMARMIQVTGKVPWKRPRDNKFWREADDAQLVCYLSAHYGLFPERVYWSCLTKVADDRTFHPVRRYLDNLPAWDGEKRVESLLVRCMEADDTDYVRTVTRKTFAAAVARAYEPGVKFDSVLVLDGAQGIGKSSFFKELVGNEYYSETLSLTDMNDKSGAEKLQGFWVVEIPELAGMKKADIEKVKGFLSTTDDKYRPSYGRVVESHPRQCIIIASVNGERGYLRDVTGNRRFWVVKVRQTEERKKWSFTPEERNQIWAEAKAIWQEGEPLYLAGDLIRDAEEAQNAAMEQDERKGLVEVYLDTLLPENWAEMDLYSRRNFFGETDNPTLPLGSVKRTDACTMEIWCECWGKNKEEMRSSDSFSISSILKQLGWVPSGKSRRLPIYGKQKMYCRA